MPIRVAKCLEALPAMLAMRRWIVRCRAFAEMPAGLNGAVVQRVNDDPPVTVILIA
jgi:hypothetical protein